MNDLEAMYYNPAPYTLTDDDVEVVNGVIQSCSYAFDLKVIIVPDIIKPMVNPRAPNDENLPSKASLSAT